MRTLTPALSLSPSSSSLLRTFITIGNPCTHPSLRALCRTLSITPSLSQSSHPQRKPPPHIRNLAPSLISLTRCSTLEKNIFEWQFAIMGSRDTKFEGGIYHGQIQLPIEYPFKPSSFMLLTVKSYLTLQERSGSSVHEFFYMSKLELSLKAFGNCLFIATVTATSIEYQVMRIAFELLPTGSSALLHSLHENEQGIFDAILRGRIDFSSDPKPSIFSSAKDLVKRLHADAKEWFSVVEVLSKGAQVWEIDVYTYVLDLVAGYCRSTASPPLTTIQELRATIHVLQISSDIV
ncbi:hypothetical protein Ahy_B06g082346 [Arachis hypogaea]|uniref:UBC core domain-containing protein n=1 Tax=Arachis hypogaea TaxID=3818 RepID=A0A444YNG2_ARAHY|nr:hypothetical protein Ahy_B06g082346 [Arachis hypogaea]